MPELREPFDENFAKNRKMAKLILEQHVQEKVK